jgi:hypothetical protein
MLTDRDLAWYADLLAQAALGTARLGLSDAMKVGQCGSAAANDPRLMPAVLRVLLRKSPQVVSVEMSKAQSELGLL